MGSEAPQDAAIRKSLQAPGGQGILHSHLCLKWGRGELENMAWVLGAPSCISSLHKGERKTTGILEILAVSQSNKM